jgi:hypothetical protein
MYLHLLTSILDDWVDELSGAALVDYAAVCRSKMLTARPRGDSAHIALAAEIAYDRALIKLCCMNGVEVDVLWLSDPPRARFRLELELADRGVDLRVPSPARH